VELSEFVEKSLVAIVRGVEKANQELAESLAQVNPAGVVYRKDLPPYLSTPDNVPSVQVVNFDVAVTATEVQSNESGGKLGIGIAQIQIASVGMTGTSSAQRETVSRLQFALPLLLTVQSQKIPQGPKRRLGLNELKKQAEGR